MKFFLRYISPVRSFFILSACLSLVFLLQPMPASADPISGADLDMGKFWVDNFGFTDDTTDANSATADDVDWPFSGGSTVYFGSTSQFEKIYFYLSAESVSSAWTPGENGLNTFQFYNGADWEDITVTNDTSAWNATGIHTFSFTPDTEWTATQVNSEGTDYYYLRISCDNGCNQMGGSIDMDQISLLSYSTGSSVPEFSDVVYLLTITGAALYVWWRLPRHLPPSTPA